MRLAGRKELDDAGRAEVVKGLRQIADSTGFGGREALKAWKTLRDNGQLPKRVGNQELFERLSDMKPVLAVNIDSGKIKPGSIVRDNQGNIYLYNGIYGRDVPHNSGGSIPYGMPHLVRLFSSSPPDYYKVPEGSPGWMSGSETLEVPVEDGKNGSYGNALSPLLSDSLRSLGNYRQTQQNKAYLAARDGYESELWEREFSAIERSVANNLKPGRDVAITTRDGQTYIYPGRFFITRREGDFWKGEAVRLLMRPTADDDLGLPAEFDYADIAHIEVYRDDPFAHPV